MYPSLWKVPGDLFADFDQIQRQFDAVFGPRGWPPGIRAVQRGAFPAINMGSSAEAVEIYVFAPGIDPAKIEVSVDKGLLTLAGERGGESPASEANALDNDAIRNTVSAPTAARVLTSVKP